MNREQIRQENQSIQRRYEDKYFNPVKRAIQIPINNTISAVKSNGAQAGLKYLSSQLSNVALTNVIQTLALEVGQRFARRQHLMLHGQVMGNGSKIFTYRRIKPPYEALKAGFGFNEVWMQWIKNFLFDFIYQKISFSVFETTKDELIRILNQSIAEGWGIEQTVKALEDSPLSASQAARIVRTEITRAANAGVMAAGETFPYEQQKEWMSAHDTRVRGLKESDHASHIALDGTVIDYNDVFVDSRNGDLLRFPGDPRASAASTINCRCSMAVVAKVGANGRLIPKRTATAA